MAGGRARGDRGRPVRARARGPRRRAGAGGALPRGDGADGRPPARGRAGERGGARRQPGARDPVGRRPRDARPGVVPGHGHGGRVCPRRGRGAAGRGRGGPARGARAAPEGRAGRGAGARRPARGRVGPGDPLAARRLLAARRRAALREPRGASPGLLLEPRGEGRLRVDGDPRGARGGRGRAARRAVPPLGDPLPRRGLLRRPGAGGRDRPGPRRRRGAAGLAGGGAAAGRGGVGARAPAPPRGERLPQAPPGRGAGRAAARAPPGGGLAAARGPARGALRLRRGGTRPGASTGSPPPLRWPGRSARWTGGSRPRSVGCGRHRPIPRRAFRSKAGCGHAEAPWKDARAERRLARTTFFFSEAQREPGRRLGKHVARLLALVRVRLGFFALDVDRLVVEAAAVLRTGRSRRAPRVD